MFHPKFEITEADVHLRALAPCQSLGAFYIAPAPASQRFLAALAHWVMYTCASPLTSHQLILWEEWCTVA